MRLTICDDDGSRGSIDAIISWLEGGPTVTTYKTSGDPYLGSRVHVLYFVPMYHAIIYLNTVLASWLHPPVATSGLIHWLRSLAQTVTHEQGSNQ
jgi:hypothetical protein